jgi:hypothetical protein
MVSPVSVLKRIGLTIGGSLAANAATLAQSGRGAKGVRREKL